MNDKGFSNGESKSIKTKEPSGKKETTKLSKQKEQPKSENGRNKSENWKNIFQEKNTNNISIKNSNKISEKWKVMTQNILVENIFNVIHVKNNRTEQNPHDKIEEYKGKMENTLTKMSKYQKKWFNEFQESLKKGLKGLNDAQKKVLENIEKLVENQKFSQTEENKFVKELIVTLLKQNAFSKDLNDLGQLNVSTISKQNSYS